MIPAHFDEATSSKAEQRIFELLRCDPKTKDWTVLHSLALTHRQNRPYGEVDFVVLIPSGGVFCLEVKGGGIACRDGVWSTTGEQGTATLKRSPFRQAQDAMWAVREAVVRLAPAGVPAEDVPFGSAVVLPDTTFQVCSQEWPAWEVIDLEALQSGVGTALHRLAMEQRKRLHTRATAAEPSPATVRSLVQLLRPDFEVVVARGTTICRSDERLLRLTEEQFAVLDGLAENVRCLCEGAAGTGKTVLALEFGRRSARSAPAGERVLLVCFNRLLGEWFRGQVTTTGLAARLVAGSYHRLLRELILKSTVAAAFRGREDQARGENFDSLYAEFGWQAIEELNDRFDLLVVDEAQDLFGRDTLDTFNCWLRGGLGNGRWAVFGDFHRQAIFGSTPGAEQKAKLRAFDPHHLRWPLRVNCRNTRNIGEETALMSGFPSPPYRLGQELGLPVDYGRYADPKSHVALLTAKLRGLLGDGVKPDDIVLLSPRRLEHSVISELARSGEFRVIEAGQPVPAHSRLPIIHFATAQAFKGMESRVVVLCDIETLGDGEPEALLYIAMSRARAQLTVLLHESTGPAYKACLRRKLTAEWTRQL